MFKIDLLHLWRKYYFIGVKDYEPLSIYYMYYMPIQYHVCFPIIEYSCDDVSFVVNVFNVYIIYKVTI